MLLEEKFRNSLDQREESANRFAKDFLIPSVELAKFLQDGKITKDSIKGFAKRLGIAPGIVVGRLQFEERLDWNQFRDLKRSFSWESWPTAEQL